jgi:microsomal dipeptidase-like Zn-dependent dipeptidase
MTNPRVLDAVRSTGGVVGIMFARTHLPDPTVRGIVDQIDAVVARIGMDYVAFGSDADGFVGLPFENLGEGYDQIMAEMRRRGYSEEDIMKIRGGNYLHAMQRREHVLACSHRARAHRGATQCRQSRPRPRTWLLAAVPAPR